MTWYNFLAKDKKIHICNLKMHLSDECSLTWDDFGPTCVPQMFALH